MKRLDKMAATALAALLAGCFTVHRSDFPDVAMTRAPEGREVSVKLAGFEATVVSYLPVYGYETVWQERVYRDRHGRLRDGGVHPETYSTTSYIPQTHVTTAFIERAQDKLEDAGFVVGLAESDYLVDVRFTGPMRGEDDTLVQCLWLFCSLLSADYGTETWSARLRISDAKTGRVLMHRDYTQKYAAAVWGPIPIFSPAAATATDSGVMQDWVLAALTDRALADATQFLSGR